MEARLTDFLSHCRVDDSTLQARDVFQEGRVRIEMHAHPTCTRFTVGASGVAESKKLLDTVSVICGASPPRARFSAGISRRERYLSKCWTTHLQTHLASAFPTRRCRAGTGDRRGGSGGDRAGQQAVEYAPALGARQEARLFRGGGSALRHGVRLSHEHVWHAAVRTSLV
jgi:hypothetical protein